ncbi:MAG: hypothetical protein AAFV53_39355 [Myxococcota bacterium]
MDGVIINTEEELQAALIELSDEIEISGAELGRQLGLGRSQGNNLLGKRSSTTITRFIRWASLVKRRLFMALAKEDIEPVLSALMERVSDMERERLLLILRFSGIIASSNNSEIRSWKFQIDAHEKAQLMDSKTSDAK